MPTSALNAVRHGDDAALHAGDRAFDEKYVSVHVHFHDFKVLDGDVFHTVLSGEVLLLEHSRRGAVRAHGTGFSVHRADAVRLFQSVLVPSLDDARETVALGDARNVHFVARLEDVRFQLRAHRIGFGVRDPDLFEHFVGFHARFLELPEFRLRQRFLARLDEAEFERRVSVVFHCLDLHHGAGTRFHDRDGNHGSVLREDLGHADFASDDCFIH